MSEDVQYGKPELLEVRQVKRQTKKRTRLFSWSFRVPSYKEPFYSQFEVFISKPTDRDLFAQTPDLVCVKFQNGSRYALDTFRLKDFLESPFVRMLNKATVNQLLEKANELNFLRVQMAEEGLERIREGN